MLSSVTTTSQNIIPITGINANANVSSTSFIIGQTLDISGIEVTANVASIIPNSQNFLQIDGLQANVTPFELRILGSDYIK